MSNQGINWHKSCPCYPWDGVSTAPECAALPGRCRWTAQRLMRSCVKAQILQQLLRRAGRKLEGEEKTRARGMSEWHALKPKKAGTQGAHTAKTGPLDITQKFSKLKKKSFKNLPTG